MTGTTMETWVFDRSGPYSGATFNVHEEPEKFVQVLCGYLMMSDDELGLDVFTDEKDGRRFIMIPVNPCAPEPIRFELNLKPISYWRAIVNRATICFAAKPIGAPEFDRVVKYSWIPSTWTPDADLLSNVNEHRAQGVATAKGRVKAVQYSPSSGSDAAIPWLEPYETGQWARRSKRCCDPHTYARPLSKAMPPHRRLQGQRLVQRQEHGNLHYVSQPGERRQNLRLSLRIQGGFEASKFTKHQALGIGH
ncbi:hypothetical protein E4U39_005327 [Claviceps sp. Clav50 group G5]|nr:hypothetical protein E4U39_005327 [Claviceps sp. Clav50 group G5]